MGVPCGDGSYVRNCILQRRDNDRSDQLFTIAHDGSHMVTKLDGYAIVPREHYELCLKLAQDAKEFCEAFLAKNTGP